MKFFNEIRVSYTPLFRPGDDQINITGQTEYDNLDGNRDQPGTTFERATMLSYDRKI